MNSLDIALTEIITNINNGTETAWGFITAQTPDVVRQLLLWHGIHSGFLFIIGILIFIFTTIGLIRFTKICNNYMKKTGYSYIGDPWILGHIFIPMFGYGIGVCFLSNITWLQIWVAPKVWILEYMAKMIK